MSFLHEQEQIFYFLIISCFGGFFNDVSLVNKTELDFSNCVINAFVFFYYYYSHVASKIETQEKMDQKVTMRLKSLIDDEI